MNVLVLFSDLRLHLRQIILLIIVRDRLARVRVGITAFGKRGIVEVPTACERPVELLLSRLCGIQAILKRLAH